MLKSISALCLGIITVIGCAAGSDSTDDAAAPVYQEAACHDARYKSVFEADEHACRVYLDACLIKLTPAQRSSWDARVGACIQDNTNAECFAEVPWC
jgi:hypothetical protein